jgi:hypothetical protein
VGVKVQFLRGAWWIVIHHGGRRKKKRIGRDRDTAERVARALREKLVRGELNLEPPSDAQTVSNYAKTWLNTMRGALKASTVDFLRRPLGAPHPASVGGAPSGFLAAVGLS